MEIMAHPEIRSDYGGDCGEEQPYPSNNGIVNGNNIVVEIETNVPRKSNGLGNKLDSSINEMRKVLKDVEVEINSHAEKRKRPSEVSYFISKELLATERTYRKDLEVVSFWFRDELQKDDKDSHAFHVVNHLLALFDPIYDAHCLLLRELELRLANWDPPTISDIFRAFFENLSLYDKYLDEHEDVIEKLYYTFVRDSKFELAYKEFESQRVCYLPLVSFVLKPLQRLAHYSHTLDKLINYYKPNGGEYYDNCCQARNILGSVIHQMPKIFRKSENLCMLYELGRDIVGTDAIFAPNREFIRQGCLAKFSQRKGYQQRMFFLFSDCLAYTGRLGYVFKVHGQLPLHNVVIEERPDTPQQHSFSIYGGNRVVTVAASSEGEKDKWLEDLTMAVQKCKTANGETLQNGDTPTCYFSLKSCNSTEDLTFSHDEAINKAMAATSPRSNNTHVCWHRNTSISMEDHMKSVENQLSGYLLRKFKNSNGWQKLWVVFTNFSLFFYKSFQEDAPLASLPLIGYIVTMPAEEDAITKDYVFKLQFKNHLYFFRADNEYNFQRWMEVIGNATQHSGRHRLFSRKESAHINVKLMPT